MGARAAAPSGSMWERRVRVWVWMCMWWAVLGAVVAPGGAERELSSNHSFVFISGWPQSGTSFVHQVLDFSTFISSMIQNCEAKLGKRCIGWNHEGQWILKGSTREEVRSGQVVQIDQWSEAAMKSVREEWASFWDLRLPVLVEKSPQSFLKIRALAHTFNTSRVRFIVVIKHPVTLNIATPKNAGWRFRRNTAFPVTRDVSTEEIDAAQRLENVQHFVTLLTLNGTAPSSSLGWIPAMQRLHALLAADASLAHAVRIVRYEHFVRPLPLCHALFAFAFNSTTRHDGRKICADLFLTRPAVVSTPAEGSSRTRHREPRRLTKEHNESRQLRLRTSPGQATLNFRAELVADTGRQRMNEFWAMARQLPRELQDQLHAIDSQLKPFGYSLYENFWQKGISARASLLAPWELKH